MLIYWFTQPSTSSQSFSSYYQYDNGTRQFVRIRLALGRDSAEGNTNDTFISYDGQHNVGFSAQQLSSKPRSDWSINDDGALCYKGNPLSSKPIAGARTWDTSPSSTSVHKGSKVTEEPSLPEGIESKHLALLANDAIISKPDDRIVLTSDKASPEQLSEAIKGEVCRILGQQDFASVTDGMILGKLTSQAKTISGELVRQSVSNMQEALVAAENANAEINKQITDGALTPDERFETAFTSLQSAVNNAKGASGADVQKALVEIGNAQQALNTAIENIDTAKYEATAKQLDVAKQSLSQAEEHATEWQTAETEYKPLTDANSVGDYMDTMSGGEDL